MDCTARGKGNERVEEVVVWVHRTVVVDEEEDGSQAGGARRV